MWALFEQKIRTQLNISFDRGAAVAAATDAAVLVGCFRAHIVARAVN